MFVIEVLTIVVLASAAFAATNLDNLVLLAALYSRYEQRPAWVIFGYFAGMLIVGGVSLAMGKASELMPITYLGFLGIIPILIGITALVNVFRGITPLGGTDERRLDSNLAVFTATLMTQLSNGADTIVTFSILIADTVNSADHWIGLSFILMLCVFASAAYYSLRHQWLSGVLERYGHVVTPFILISVGLYVLANTATDMMPG